MSYMISDIYKSGILILSILVLLMIIKPKLIIIVKEYQLPKYVFFDISDSLVTRNIAKIMFNVKHTTKEKISLRLSYFKQQYI